MDLSTVMQLANNPRVRPLLHSLLQRFGDVPPESKGPANLTGLVQYLDRAGLSEQVRSWTGNGENAQVTGSQLSAALGSQMLDQIAQENCTTADDAADGLAVVLPKLVDSSTDDDGQVSRHPDIGSLLGTIAGR